jgi:hypothetical protein
VRANHQGALGVIRLCHIPLAYSSLGFSGI